MNEPLGELMGTAMDKIHGMVSSNTSIGEPIVTADGTTLVPVSRVSYGFASGGNDKTGANARTGVWGGSGAAERVEPVGFLLIRDGGARMVSIQAPAVTAADRILDLLPELMSRVERYLDKYLPGKKQNG
ncbi:MAG: sporulation protein YtfJ [Oscillospiraceae bacterium]|nr:sporulation protein YtfJ [Oscillospiraceae bacterium]